MKGIKKSSNLTQIKPKDTNKFWIGLKYTKPKSNNITLALIGLNNKIAVIIQNKKVLIRLHPLTFPPIFHKTKYMQGQNTTHLFVTRDKAGRVLLCQSIKKTTRCNIHNIQIFCILWD